MMTFNTEEEFQEYFKKQPNKNKTKKKVEMLRKKMDIAGARFFLRLRILVIKLKGEEHPSNMSYKST